MRGPGSEPRHSERFGGGGDEPDCGVVRARNEAVHAFASRYVHERLDVLRLGRDDHAEPEFVRSPNRAPARADEEDGSLHAPMLPGTAR